MTVPLLIWLPKLRSWLKPLNLTMWLLTQLHPRLSNQKPPMTNHRLNCLKWMTLWQKSSKKTKRWRLIKDTQRSKLPNLPLKKLLLRSKPRKMPRPRACPSQISFHLMTLTSAVSLKRPLIRNQMPSRKLMLRLRLNLVLKVNFQFKSNFNKLKSNNKL